MLSAFDIIELNQSERDFWIRGAIKRYFSEGCVVLDVGAGTSPYRKDLVNYQYIAHDFGEYKGPKLGGTDKYAPLDVVSDVCKIPLPDQTVDFLLCTEVLEHVPEPLDALREFSRLLRPRGRAIVTTPFTSGLHQEPYHFYAGFSPAFYHYAAKKFGFSVLEVSPHGGFLRLMSQELCRLAGMPISSKIENWRAYLVFIANEILQKDIECPIPQFSIGYHVALQKI